MYCAVCTVQDRVQYCMLTQALAASLATNEEREIVEEREKLAARAGSAHVLQQGKRKGAAVSMRVETCMLLPRKEHVAIPGDCSPRERHYVSTSRTYSAH